MKFEIKAHDGPGRFGKLAAGDTEVVEKSIKMVENDQYRVQQYVTALRALKTIYARLEMYDQMPDITKRLQALGLDN